MHILIVDDSEDVRSFLMQLLRDQGHAVREAVNGQEGLSRVREQRPDAIICDGLMPVMDGFQLLQALKRDSSLSSIPFIFLSSVYTGQREQNLALSLGADAFLVKPQPPKAILDALQAVTGGRVKAARPASALNEDEAELAQEYSRVVAAALEKKVGELRTASDEWRATFDAMTEAVALLDADGRIMRCNRAMATLAKKPFSEIIGQACTKMCACFGGTREECPFIKSKKTLKRETVVFQRDEQWFEASADPIVDETGALQGAVHILQEITERKHAEEILKKREAQLTESQRIAGIGSWERDLATNTVVWSKELFRILGLDSEQVTPSYEALQGLIHPDDRETQMRTVQQAIQGNKPYRTEFRIQRKDGTTAVIHTQGEVVCDEAGRPVLIRGTAQDITERRRLEDELKAAAARAEDEKAKADSIVAAIGDGITIQDRNFRILYQNQAAKKLIGNHVGEQCYRAYEKRAERCEGCGVAQVFKDGGTHVVERSAPTDKGLLYAEITASPLRDAKGEIIAGIEVVHDITKRKQRDAALLASEERYRLIFQGSPVGIFHYDTGLIITECNDRFIEILKTKREKLMGLDMHILRDQRVLPSLKTALSGKEGRYEGAYKATTSSAEIWVAMRTAPLFDLEGAVKGGVGIVEDITERREAEESLRESEERYRNVIENAFDLIQSVSPEGRFLYVNPSWSRTMGFSLEELRDKTIFDIIHPSCKSKCSSVFNSMATGAALEHFETQFMAKDGRVIDIEGSATSRTVGGRVVSMQCLLHDVTERKKLQEQLFRTQQDWEYTFNSITDMVTVHDADYNIILANKAAQKILHLPILEKVKDRKCFSYYHGTDHAPEGCPSCGCLQTGAPAMFEIFEPHLNMFIEIRAIPRFDSNGTLIGLIHVVRDITERKQLEQQIKAHTEQLEVVVGERTRELEDANRELQTVNRELILRREEADTASRSKTDFLANMSHELRTPLNAIMGFSEIMLMDMAGPVSDKQREFLNDISNSGKHLLSLINDILDLSKVEAGKMELEPEPVNVGELLDGSLMMFKEKALKHAISMTTGLEASLPEIIADRRKLKQVLVNLLSNAFKFTPDGGSVSVQARRLSSSELRARSWETDKNSSVSGLLGLGAKEVISDLRTQHSELDADFIEISVADTGAGITPEHQRKLFQPFQQIDSSLTRKHMGTGLGLSLCRRFVELHGGRIWVESEPGKGSTFSFVVPVSQAAK